MDQENVYYYALHAEIQKSLTDIKQKLNDAITGNNIINNSFEYKKLRDNLIKQDQISGILFNTYHNTANSFYKVSKQLRKLLDELCSYTEEIEFSRLESSINSDIMQKNYYDKVDKLHQAEEKMLQLLQETSLSNHQLIIDDSSSEYGKTSVSVADAVRKTIELEIELLDRDQGIIDLKYQDILVKDMDSSIMIDSNIFDNSEELIEQTKIKQKSAKIIELCHQIQVELEKEEADKGIKFTKLQETISMISTQNQASIDAANQYFTNIVFDKYTSANEQELNFEKEQEIKEEKEKLYAEIVEEYENLSKELKELQLKLPEYKINLDSLEQRLKSIDIDSLNNEKVIENVEYNAAMSF